MYVIIILLSPDPNSFLLLLHSTFLNLYTSRKKKQNIIQSCSFAVTVEKVLLLSERKRRRKAFSVLSACNASKPTHAKHAALQKEKEVAVPPYTLYIH